MTTPALLSTESVFFLVQGAITAVSDLPGLTPEQKQTLVEQAWDVILAYGPVDAQRAMLIGQSLMLNEMLAQAGTDAIRGGGHEDMSRAARASYASIYRAFHQNQTALAKLQAKAEAAETKPAKTEAPVATADEAAPVAEPAPHAPEADPDQIPEAAQPAELSVSAASSNNNAASAGQHHQRAPESTFRAPEQPGEQDDSGEEIPHAPGHDAPTPRARNGHVEAPELAEA
jgi:hypothetical protein